MKKFFAVCFLLLWCASVKADVLQAGVAIDEVPKSLFGTWRVNAKLDATNSYKSFKPQSVDFWNLSKQDDKLYLENPISGANAYVSIDTVEGNLIVFSRKTPFGNNKFLTDTVNLRIEGDKFSGVNYLKLESFSLIDNHLMKTETAEYLVKGEKVAGENVIDE